MRLPIAALALLCASAAHAQQQCAPAGAMIAKLEGQFGETRRTGGTVGTEVATDLMVIYANDETGSWTLLRLNANGTACMISSGMNWMDLSPTEPEGDPA